MTVTLFGLQRSVYTRIARLALAEKQVPHRLCEVEIFGPGGVPPEHFARHPFGRIPALDHDGFMLYETSAITRYVDEAFDGPALQPREPRLRARMSQIIGVLDAYAYRPLVWGVFVQRVRLPLQGQATDDDEVQRSLAAAEPVLGELERWAGRGQYLCGAALTLADLHAYPMLRCFSLAPEGDAALRRHPTLAAWFTRMPSLPSVTATRTAYESRDVSGAARPI
jgi:glutathione S-transferase